jgi:hypothetical protein
MTTWLGSVAGELVGGGGLGVVASAIGAGVVDGEGSSITVMKRVRVIRDFVGPVENVLEALPSLPRTPSAKTGL